MVPIVAQVILCSYWTAYWPQLGAWLPFLLVLVAFALATDATMSWTVRHRLVLGFGPVPITLGMHLFAQFSPVDWHALEASGRSDFYAKVIPTPLLNVLAPTFDRLGDALVAAGVR